MPRRSPARRRRQNVQRRLLRTSVRIPGRGRADETTAESSVIDLHELEAAHAGSSRHASVTVLEAEA